MSRCFARTFAGQFFPQLSHFAMGMKSNERDEAAAVVVAAVAAVGESAVAVAVVEVVVMVGEPSAG